MSLDSSGLAWRDVPAYSRGFTDGFTRSGAVAVVHLRNLAEACAGRPEATALGAGLIASAAVLQEKWQLTLLDLEAARGSLVDDEGEVAA